MAKLVPFRVHFESEDVLPFDVEATSSAEARQRAAVARPSEIIRKIKVVRETATVSNLPATEGATS